MAGMNSARQIHKALRRKAAALPKRATRVQRRLVAKSEDYAERPPILLNTVPKSGTHLVHQILGVFPGCTDYGNFLATTASYRRKPKSVANQLRQIKAFAPGEIVRAHLRHDPHIAEALRARGVFVIFVHRDPRDLAVSAASYLSDLAPWHPLHRVYARRTPSERIDLQIRGLTDAGGHHPDAGTRLAMFADWLDDADVVLSYEELVAADTQRASVRRLVEAYAKAASTGLDVDATTDRAIAAIDPSRSHTFREGRVGSWHEVMSPEQKEAFDSVAAPLLSRFGYPPTLSEEPSPRDGLPTA